MITLVLVVVLSVILRASSSIKAINDHTTNNYKLHIYLLAHRDYHR
jgi:hypothetical protein